MIVVKSIILPDLPKNIDKSEIGNLEQFLLAGSSKEVRNRKNKILKTKYERSFQDKLNEPVLIVPQEFFKQKEHF